MAQHRPTGAWPVPKLCGKYFPYFYYVWVFILKLTIVTTVVQVMQLGQFANEAADALSHPPNSTVSHSVLCAFIEVSMVSTSVLHPNVSLNSLYCHLFFV
jgi:hypothetical protein